MQELAKYVEDTDEVSLPEEELFQEDEPIYSREITLFAGVMATTFSLIGILGNLMTVLALTRCSKLRNQSTTGFIISLSMSDLLFCSINLPITAVRYFYERWLFGPFLCRIYPFFFYGNVGASLMSLAAITINRYVLIAKPGVYSRIYTRSNQILMILSLWAFSFGILIPPLFNLWGTFGLKQESFSCTILRDEKGRSPKKFLFIFGFFFPCLVIVTCYSAIYYTVLKSRENLKKYSQGRPRSSLAISEQQKKDDLKMTKMMFLIFVSFLVSFLPLTVSNVLDEQVMLPKSFDVISSILAWMSAVINPFIYALKNSQYRQAFKKVCTFQRRSNSLPSPVIGISMATIPSRNISVY